MRHKIGHRKLQRSAGHRTALLRNLAASLIKHEQILTGTAKAKELRPYVEKLITLAKKGGLSNRRLASSRLQDDAQLTKLFEVLAERYKDRNGGYTRVIKAGFRASDAAPVAIIELIDREFIAAIREGREPNSSLAQCLPAMQVMDIIERQFSS